MTAADALDFTAVDELADSFQRRGGQPALVYGIVAGGRLAHARGLGHRWLGGPAPDARTVFRIASITKSFTAAAVLLLRDERAIALDDPVEDYVPELRILTPASPDAPRISVRHLLTMTAGFPTDNQWGDRLQGLPPDQFSRLLSGELRFAWAPGTRFEYSNLSYAILGQVITAASGTPYPDFVRHRLLRPLRLSQTGFAAPEFDPARLARGYQHSPEGWKELLPDGCGAFAPMGGIFSCVADLARWVSGFAAAFPPAEPDSGGAHPLLRASRREMQMPLVALGSQAPTPLPGDPSGTGPLSYGLGLFVEESASRGRIVSHSGGYPGYGCHMRWHPVTGTGVIVLANSTYAPVSPLAARLLEAVLPQVPAAGPQIAPPVSGPAPAPGGPWPETVQARREVGRLLLAWDDAMADQLFAENVALDEPYPERRRKLAVIRERIGDLREDPGRAAEFDSPAHCRWWLRGERAAVQAEIRLTPERHPRIQSLTFAMPPAPDSPLARLLASLVSLLNDGARDWPSTLPASSAVDKGLVLRQFRMAAAWAGRCRTGAFRAGNGETALMVELVGETANLVLAVVVDAAGALAQAHIMLGS